MIDRRNKSVRKFSISNATTGTSGSQSSTGTSLGSQVIEGLLVEGTQFTRTIDAGQVGNERPLEISVEAWYSSDLQTVLLRKTTDPRLGHIVYKVTDVQRIEPDPSLFQIPAGFAIREDATIAK